MHAIGTVKSINGAVFSENTVGEETFLKVGDVVNSEDTIATKGENSHAVILLLDGQELTLGSDDSLLLDHSVYNAKSFGDEAIISSQTAYDIFIEKGGLSFFADDSSINLDALIALNSSDIESSSTQSQAINPLDIISLPESETIIKIEGFDSDMSAIYNPSEWAPMADQSNVDTGYIRYEYFGEHNSKHYIDLKDTLILSDFV